LKTPVGKDIKPHLKRAAVDFFLHTLSKSFPSKIASTYENNKAKNCKHIQLNYKEFIVTASYVKNSSDLPREAIFRDDLIDLNYSLFEEQNVPEKIYVILTHGGDKIPEFANFKIPSKRGTHHTISLGLDITPVETEDTDFDIELEIKNFIDFQKAVNEK
jgi:hypothetical protein